MIEKNGNAYAVFLSVIYSVNPHSSRLLYIFLVTFVTLSEFSYPYRLCLERGLNCYSIK